MIKIGTIRDVDDRNYCNVTTSSGTITKVIFATPASGFVTKPKPLDKCILVKDIHSNIWYIVGLIPPVFNGEQQQPRLNIKDAGKKMDKDVVFMGNPDTSSGVLVDNNAVVSLEASSAARIFAIPGLDTIRSVCRRHDIDASAGRVFLHQDDKTGNTAIQILARSSKKDDEKTVLMQFGYNKEIKDAEYSFQISPNTPEAPTTSIEDSHQKDPMFGGAWNGKNRQDWITRGHYKKDGTYVFECAGSAAPADGAAGGAAAGATGAAGTAAAGAAGAAAGAAGAAAGAAGAAAVGGAISTASGAISAVLGVSQSAAGIAGSVSGLASSLSGQPSISQAVDIANQALEIAEAFPKLLAIPTIPGFPQLQKGQAAKAYQEALDKITKVIDEAQLKVKKFIREALRKASLSSLGLPPVATAAISAAESAVLSGASPAAAAASAGLAAAGAAQSLATAKAGVTQSVAANTSGPAKPVVAKAASDAEKDATAAAAATAAASDAEKAAMAAPDAMSGTGSTTEVAAASSAAAMATGVTAAVPSAPNLTVRVNPDGTILVSTFGTVTVDAKELLFWAEKSISLAGKSVSIVAEDSIRLTPSKGLILNPGISLGISSPLVSIASVDIKIGEGDLQELVKKSVYDFLAKEFVPKFLSHTHNIIAPTPGTPTTPPIGVTLTIPAVPIAITKSLKGG